MKPITVWSSSSGALSFDEAVVADRLYFDEHPDENEFVRDHVPGEFDEAELPEIQPGFRYATKVTAMRVKGRAIVRTRRLVTLCDAENLKRLAGYA
jgi:hypothetical protein